MIAQSSEPLLSIYKTFYVVSSLASSHSQLHSKPHHVDALNFSKKWFTMFYAGAISFCSLFGPWVYFPYIIHNLKNGELIMNFYLLKFLSSADNSVPLLNFFYTAEVSKFFHWLPTIWQARLLHRELGTSAPRELKVLVAKGQTHSLILCLFILLFGWFCSKFLSYYIQRLMTFLNFQRVVYSSRCVFFPVPYWQDIPVDSRFSLKEQ